ncbi:hypothetical protein [Ferrimonas balearica]|uniref:hypothetical protein n=1 Tax=Ferrimonas balearica TaxID=44012 RepID=UPI001C9989C8|nr:hypothetical protein [Ferrimonas balearica]MBY5990999.1 hypothetical protein [Ferrimonas balearica]
MINDFAAKNLATHLENKAKDTVYAARLDDKVSELFLIKEIGVAWGLSYGAKHLRVHAEHYKSEEAALLNPSDMLADLDGTAEECLREAGCLANSVDLRMYYDGRVSGLMQARHSIHKAIENWRPL